MSSSVLAPQTAAARRLSRPGRLIIHCHREEDPCNRSPNHSGHSIYQDGTRDDWDYSDGVPALRYSDYPVGPRFKRVLSPPLPIFHCHGPGVSCEFMNRNLKLGRSGSPSSRQEELQGHSNPRSPRDNSLGNKRKASRKDSMLIEDNRSQDGSHENNYRNDDSDSDCGYRPKRRRCDSDDHTNDDEYSAPTKRPGLTSTTHNPFIPTLHSIGARRLSHIERQIIHCHREEDPCNLPPDPQGSQLRSESIYQDGTRDDWDYSDGYPALRYSDYPANPDPRFRALLPPPLPITHCHGPGVRCELMKKLDRETSLSTRFEELGHRSRLLQPRTPSSRKSQARSPRAFEYNNPGDKRKASASDNISSDDNHSYHGSHKDKHRNDDEDSGYRNGRCRCNSHDHSNDGEHGSSTRRGVRDYREHR